MIHKIAPHIYYPEFRSSQPAESDFVCIFNGNSIFLIKDEEKKLLLPTFANLEKKFGGDFSLKCFADQAEYLFSIDSTAFFRLDILALSLTALPAEDFHSPMGIPHLPAGVPGLCRHHGLSDQPVPLR